MSRLRRFAHALRSLGALPTAALRAHDPRPLVRTLALWLLLTAPCPALAHNSLPVLPTCVLVCAVLLLFVPARRGHPGTVPTCPRAAQRHVVRSLRHPTSRPAPACSFARADVPATASRAPSPVGGPAHARSTPNPESAMSRLRRFAHAVRRRCARAAAACAPAGPPRTAARPLAVWLLLALAFCGLAHHGIGHLDTYILTFALLMLAVHLR